MPKLALGLIACFLVASCAQQAQAVTVHLQATQTEPEHDEVVSSNGFTDFYPSRDRAHEAVFHNNQGVRIDANCLDSDCKQVLLKIGGSSAVPDGVYQFLQTDDPRIVMMRDGSATRVLGYFAQNDGGGTYKFFSDFKSAQDYEHKGDAARAAGKIALGVLLVAGIVVLAAAGAAAGAHENAVASTPVTTTCNSFGSQTSCTSY